MCVKVPAGGFREGQQRDDRVAQTLAERTQELSVLHIVAGVNAEPLLSTLLFSLHCFKIPAGGDITHSYNKKARINIHFIKS